MNLGLSMEAAGVGESALAGPGAPAAAPRSAWSGRYSPRACAVIWLAASAAAWGVVIGLGAGVVALARLVLG